VSSRRTQPLQDSEARDRGLIAQVRDYAIFAIDADGRASSWNEGVGAVLGYTEGEFIGSPIELAFLPADVAAGVPAMELETARRKGVANNDRWMRRKDGTAFFATGRTTRLNDAEGRCIGFSKVLRDDTPLALATERLRNSEERYRTLIENLRDYAIFMVDPNGLITDWTEGAQRVHGFTAHEVLGRHVSLLYTPEQVRAGMSEQELAQAAREGRLERDVWRMHRSGERLWVNEITTAVRTADHVVTGFTRISRDLTQRKRRDEDSAYLAALIRHSADAILGLSVDGVIRSWNASAESLFGYTAAQIVGLSNAVLAPAHLHEAQRGYLERLRAGETVRTETVRLHRDGHELFVLLTAGPVTDAAGKVIGVSASLVDIGPRKQTEAALHAAQRRQSFLLQLGDRLRRLIDPLEIQAEACRMLGEEIGANRVYYAEYESDEDHLRIRVDYHRDAPTVVGDWRIGDYGRHVAAAFRAGQTVAIKDTAIDPIIEDDVRASYAAMQIGACVGIPLIRSERLVVMMAVLQTEPRAWHPDEITLIEEAAQRSWEAIGRGRAEARLRYSEERLARALAIQTVGVIFFKADGAITETNDAFLRMSGFDREDVERGRLTWQGSTPPEFLEVSNHSMYEFLTLGNTTPYEKQFIRKDGSRWWGLFAATRLPDGSGVEFIVETSQRKQLEESLREADRRKDEFLATLAHELRNPLAPIRNGLQIARIAAKHDERLLRTIAMMDRQLSHLVHLVDDLLDLGRISAGKIELRRRTVALKDLIVSSAEASRATIDAHEHHLTIDVPDEDLFVHADFDRLTQVFSNLLSNAAKYTERGGRIAMTAVRDGTTAVVRVSDTGIGIPASELSRVFNLFSQVRTHQGHSEGGLGIGLSLVQSLVAMHGGSVKADSAGIDQGSTFTVRLPLADPMSTQARLLDRRDARSSDAQTLRVLIADDNRDSAESLAALLEMDGHIVATASDGVQAIEQVQAFAPDIVILDLGMPNVDGVEAARRIRSLPGGERVLLVALTGWGQESDRQRTREAGFDRHLVKPVDLAALKEVFGSLPLPR
jgi:PAS domain S-box-containing protein